MIHIKEIDTLNSWKHAYIQKFTFILIFKVREISKENIIENFICVLYKYNYLQ